MWIFLDCWLYSIALSEKWVNTNQASKQWGNICHSYWRPGTSLSGRWYLWQKRSWRIYKLNEFYFRDFTLSMLEGFCGGREILTVKKILSLMSCREIGTSLLFFGFLANLEQSGGWIPKTGSPKVTFSVIVSFCLTKTENRTKKSLSGFSHSFFE